MNDMRLTERNMTDHKIKMQARGVDVFYGHDQAIKNVDVDIEETRSRPSSARQAAGNRPSCAA